MRIFVLVFVVALMSLTFLPSATTAGCKLEMEGVYHSSIDSVTSAYLRFYSDGTVLHTTSIEKPEEVMKFFNKEHAKQVLKGDYSFGKCYVTCSVYGKTGKMKFAGSVKGDSLFLQAKNSSDGTSTQLAFGFVEDATSTAKKK
jgi:hypothetical protein